MSQIDCLYRAGNKGTSNVNDVPFLAVDVPNQNLERHDEVPNFLRVNISCLCLSHLVSDYSIAY